MDGPGRIGLGEQANERDYEEKWAHVSEALASIDPRSNSTLLDAGCGNGWFTRRFHDLGFQVEAVDFSAKAVRTAQRGVGKADVVWHVAPLYELHLRRTFDLVVCIDVLFHVVDDGLWERSVASLSRHVSPRGRLIVQDQLVAPSDARRPEEAHVRWRSIDDYKRALSGWQVSAYDAYRLPESGDEKHLVVLERTP